MSLFLPQQYYQPLAATISRPATVSYRTYENQASAASAYTFTSKDIGTAATGRRVIVVAKTYLVGSDHSHSSMTIGGVSATNLVASTQATAGNGLRAVISMWGLQVDAGTTATIVLNASISVSAGSVAVFAAYDLLSMTPTATANPTNATAAAVTANLNISASGIAIVGMTLYDNNGTLTGTTWTNLTEQQDAVELSSQILGSSASDAFASAQTGLAITATRTGGGGASGCSAGAFAAFR